MKYPRRENFILKAPKCVKNTSSLAVMPATEHDRPADELVALLARRIEVLEAVLEAPRTRPELVDTLDISRSTVDRAVRELEDMGLVRFNGDSFSATLVGQLAHTEYETLRTDLVTLEEVSPLLTSLPSTAPVDLRILRDAEVVAATEPAPHVPGSRISALLRQADSVRSLSMAYTTPETGDVIADSVAAGELSTEIVFEAALYEYLTDSEVLDVEALVDDPNVSAGIVDTLPFGLIIARHANTTDVCLAIYDDDRTLEGVVINDSQPAVDWATAVWEEYQERARPIE